jgi:hemerythrin-like domain-containing protein
MVSITTVDGIPPSAVLAAVPRFERKRLAERVRRDHATIRTLLDDVERACAVVNEGHAGSQERVRRAVWDLYLVFDEHLAMEEAHVAPVLRAFDARGEQRAVAMILEHNEQRRLILELVEDAEREAKLAAELVCDALALVVAFRTDMEIEESSLAVVLVETPPRAVTAIPG